MVLLMNSQFNKVNALVEPVAANSIAPPPNVSEFKCPLVNLTLLIVVFTPTVPPRVRTLIPNILSWKAPTPAILIIVVRGEPATPFMVIF
jgi:hypothetical protein